MLREYFAIDIDEESGALVGLPVLVEGQGLTLVHIFAQLEPFLSLKPAKHPTTWDRRYSR